MDPSAYLYLRMVRRAAKRGEGGGWKVRPFTEELLLALALAAGTDQEKEVVDFSILAYFFLLRIDEALSLGDKDLAISAGNVVRVHIAMSRTDQEGLGVDRRAKCVCKTVVREPPAAARSRPDWGSLVCPFHAARRILTARRTVEARRVGRLSGAGDQDGLAYRSYLRTLDHLVKKAGRMPTILVKKGGKLVKKRVFGGHSGRRGGAQALARAKVPTALIKLWGRWRSNAVDRYLEEAALENAEEAIAQTMVTSEQRMKEEEERSTFADEILQSSTDLLREWLPEQQQEV